MNRAWFGLHDLSLGTLAFAPHHVSLQTAECSVMTTAMVVFASRQDRTDRAPSARLG
jgi:hypothetical protein